MSESASVWSPPIGLQKCYKIRTVQLTFVVSLTSIALLQKPRKFRSSIFRIWSLYTFTVGHDNRRNAFSIFFPRNISRGSSCESPGYRVTFRIHAMANAFPSPLKVFGINTDWHSETCGDRQTDQVIDSNPVGRIMRRESSPGASRLLTGIYCIIIVVLSIVICSTYHITHDVSINHDSQFM